MFDKIETIIDRDRRHGFPVRTTSHVILQIIASDLRKRAGEFDFVTESIIVGIADVYEKGE